MRRVLLIVVCSCLSLSDSAPPTPPTRPQVVDLSHFYDNNTLYWVGGTPFRFTKMYTRGSGSPGSDWYSANEFETAEHGGTHLDAPYHFDNAGWQVGEIPLDRLIGTGVHMDLRKKASEDPDYLVTDDDFEKWEKTHGPMPEGAVVLLDFGWAPKYKNDTEFFGTNTVSDGGSYHFPGLAESGAKWLVETGKVYGVGTDTASIDYGQSKDFPAHKILSKNKIYNLEHVAMPENDHSLTGYQIISMPMKIRHGSGAPCRVLAIPKK